MVSCQLQHPLPMETNIPDHFAFTKYGPSFTLDVPAGYMTDVNSAMYLDHVDEAFRGVDAEIRRRMEL